MQSNSLNETDTISEHLQRSRRKLLLGCVVVATIVGVVCATQTDWNRFSATQTSEIKFYPSGYDIAGSGQNCASIGMEDINSASDCEQAASSMGVRWLGTGGWKIDLRGCEFIHGAVAYNTDMTWGNVQDIPDQYKSQKLALHVCKVPPKQTQCCSRCDLYESGYMIADSKQNCATIEMDDIFSEKDCEHAAASLGKKWLGAAPWHIDLRGCEFIHGAVAYNKDLRWRNVQDIPDQYSSQKLALQVCKVRPTQSEPPPCCSRCTEESDDEAELPCEDFCNKGKHEQAIQNKCKLPGCAGCARCK